jgi:hypothetical protein
VIVKLNVEPDKVEQFVKDWAIDAAIFKNQPGFISEFCTAKLLRMPSNTSINSIPSNTDEV